MQEAEIWGIAEAGDGYMVFIKPVNSNYSVPIFIGQLESQAILIGYGGVSISRPLTVDLLLTMIKESGFELFRVEINELKDCTFFSRLVLKKSSGEEIRLDSRPSDALALAVRCKCPIYIAEKIIQEAGIPIDDLNGNLATDEETQKRFLRDALNEAVAVENYERAAEIRDMLNLLEK